MQVLKLPDDFLQAFQQLCDAFLTFDIPSDVLAKVQCPSLVVTAEKDILKVPAYSQYLARHIPRAKLEVVKGAGHAVVMEQPQVVNALVQRFIENC